MKCKRWHEEMCDIKKHALAWGTGGGFRMFSKDGGAGKRKWNSQNKKGGKKEKNEDCPKENKKGDKVGKNQGTCRG